MTDRRIFMKRPIKRVGFKLGNGYKYHMSAIKTATQSDIQALYSLTSAENHVKDNQYFERCLLEQENGTREVLLILVKENIAGYCQYQRNPRYQPFRSLGIPEIQDIYVHPDYRRNGLATKLIEACIDKAKSEAHDLIGIGVGLYSNYGKAQKLYFKMGFEPDGGGVVYERETVSFGQLCPVDDELCLMMIKPLK